MLWTSFLWLEFVQLGRVLRVLLEHSRLRVDQEPNAVLVRKIQDRFRSVLGWRIACATVGTQGRMEGHVQHVPLDISKT